MQKELLQWYRSHKRELPWRKNRDPYRIWISEVMLQQTTVAAVIPFYEKFMKRFPSVQSLAKSDEADVLEMWAGLGYYSRARNILKSARIIAEKGFPKNAAELLELPGFGPYTSRAVASLAFNEPVGVLDGNVIRVLSRVYSLQTEWWLPRERNRLQKLADELAQTEHNSDINQGMMELGATVCTPRKPLCLLCPWKKNCKSLSARLVEKIPLAKPKPAAQIWQWDLQVEIKNNKILLEKNKATPFLPDLLFPPGQARQLKKKPKKFQLRHGVTKYDIYISLHTGSTHEKLSAKSWYDLKTIKKINPTSLMTKILKEMEK